MNLATTLGRVLTAFLALIVIASTAGTTFAQDAIGNSNLGKHRNWDVGTMNYTEGLSDGYVEGDYVPHAVDFEVSTSGPFFFDLCFEAIKAGIYGYGGIGFFNETYAVDEEYDGSTPFPTGTALDTVGTVIGTNVTFTGITALQAGGFSGACDGSTEIGQRVTFTVPNPDSVSALYYGGLLSFPGLISPYDGNLVGNSTSSGNDTGNWQSRAESGGDKTVQVKAPETGGIQLPVELTSFEGRAVDGDVVLEWTTASETDNAGFEVEQSNDGESFRTVGFVAGNGTTDQEQAYTFRVSEVGAGVHVFRLKQIDFDGAFEYSSAVEVVAEVPGSHELSDAYPNPFNPSTTFSLVVSRDQDVRIDVFDILGRMVDTIYDGSMEANQVRNFTIDATSLTSGSYLYVVRGESFLDSRSILLVK